MMGAFLSSRFWPALLACMLGSVLAFGQVQKGIVTDEAGNALPGAWVAWPGLPARMLSSADGIFEIPKPNPPSEYLVSGCPGFQTDTFLVDGWDFARIELTAHAKNMKEVQVVGQRQGSYIQPGSVVKTEVITRKELTKAACCDMAGCFETQATVQPQVTNVITNAKELRILGLSGVYNQVLVDGLPMMQGLSYAYGIGTIPSAIIDQIFVSKGANSVLQGFEGISGQINVITRNPEKEPGLFANGYINNFGEVHVNANYAGALDSGRRWTNITGLHMVQPANKRDRDGDGFLDLPLLTRYSAFTRFNYGRENEAGWFFQTSLRVTREDRIGGQRLYNPETDKGSTRLYGQAVSFLQPEWILKLGYRFSARHAVQYHGSVYGQDQNSWYGTLNYKARQQNANMQVQHQFRPSESTIWTWGGSVRLQHQKETIGFSDTLLNRTYQGTYSTPLAVPGIFGEYSGGFLEDKLHWIAGVRFDHHQVSGGFLTPRTMIRYEFLPGNTLRASLGTGWRQVNLFAENMPLLASSRNVVFEESIRPERAVNWGGNYTYQLDREKIKGTISVDFYQTRFQNQFFPDYNREAGSAFIRNFEGTSRSNSAQAEANLKIYERWEVKMAYNYLDVFRLENGKKETLPFNPINRAMGAISYRPLHNWFVVDGNVHWFDRQKLPSTLNANGEAGPGSSKPYAVYTVQVTVKWKKTELYGGVENIFDFRQRQPIAGWQQPFGPNFDTGSVWGPTRGREFYIGLRWKPEA